MAKFTTRVELYEKSTDKVKPDYEALHAAMEKKGFTRTISWEGEKETYWMPHAEYNYTKDATKDEVKDLAVQAASTVWKDFGVLVTEAAGARAKHNLKLHSREQ
jgi:hypothetical protein